MAYFLNVGIGLTHLLNAVVGGSPYESTSGHAWRRREQPFWGFVQRVVDWVFAKLGYTNHCQRQYEIEEERRKKLSM